MSDLRIALIAEGPTDKVIIEAALNAILNRPFILANCSTCTVQSFGLDNR